MAPLEAVQCRHDVLDNVILLGDLSLYLLPFNLPILIINCPKQPGDKTNQMSTLLIHITSLTETSHL